MQIRDKPGLEYSAVPVFLCSLPKSCLLEVGEWLLRAMGIFPRKLCIWEAGSA